MSTVKFKGSTSGEAEVTVAAAAGTPTITLPTASINLATDGSNGQYLKTNGSGTLSFDTPTDTTTPADATVTEAKLNANAPTNDHVLTADDTTAGGFKWAAASAGAALTGSTDNTVVTVTGANAMQGEANLKFDGSQLDLDTGSGTFNRWKTDQLRFNSTGTAHIDHYTNGQQFKFRVSGSSGADTTAFEIFSDGNVEVSSGNLVIGTSGKGIDFGATGDTGATGSSVDSEVLDEYEEGEWDITPNNNNLTFTDPTCKYTKIGNLVTCVGKIDVASVSGSNLTYLELPFSCAHFADYGNASGCAMIHTNIDAGGDTCGMFIPGNTPWVWLFGSQDNGGWRHISNSHLSTSSEMIFSFSYRTTA